MLRLVFETDNAAFSDEKHRECASILRIIAKQIDNGRWCGPVKDSNGNQIGEWEILEETPTNPGRVTEGD